MKYGYATAFRIRVSPRLRAVREESIRERDVIAVDVTRHPLHGPRFAALLFAFV